MAAEYIYGRDAYGKRLSLAQGMNWQTVFEIPSSAEIQKHNRKSRIRSPYIYGWLSIPAGTIYTEYSIEFKAEYLPKGTYCCLGNWTMDYSSLERQYKSVRTEYQGVHAYAGFQNLHNGKMVSIMSFWDIFCKDSYGRETVIRAKRVYPKMTSYSEEFTGEGTGVHCTVPYDWKANHWYRMHLRCVTSRETGNTVVEQWVCDVETEQYVLLCSYDTGVKNSSFKGSIAVFLENYLTEYSGEVRSMEVRNAKYFNAVTKKWQSITEAYIGSDSGLPRYEGSYNFGAFGNEFWMITSGVGGDWFNNGKGRKGTHIKVRT